MYGRGMPYLGLIYGLYDPETRDLRYIGQTRRSVEARFREHLWGSGGSESKVEWIQGLKARGLTPIVRIIDKVEDLSVLSQIEQSYIRKALRDKRPIFNKPVELTVSQCKEENRVIQASLKASGEAHSDLLYHCIIHEVSNRSGGRQFKEIITEALLLWLNRVSDEEVSQLRAANHS